MSSQTENEALFQDIATYLEQESAIKQTYRSIATGFVRALGYDAVLEAVKAYQNGSDGNGGMLAMLREVSTIAFIPDLDRLVATALTGEPQFVHPAGRTVITSFTVRKPFGAGENGVVTMMGAAGFCKVPVISGVNSGLQAFVHEVHTNIIARVSPASSEGLHIQTVREA